MFFRPGKSEVFVKVCNLVFLLFNGSAGEKPLLHLIKKFVYLNPSNLVLISC